MTVSLAPPGHSSSHGDLDDLLIDDHLIYALLAGRAGGQALIGGTASGEQLNLRGSTHAGLGSIRILSQMRYDVAQASASPQDPNGAAMLFSGGIATSTSNFLMTTVRLAYSWNVNANASDSIFRDTRTINYNAVGQTAQGITFYQANPNIVIGNAANRLPQLLVMNWTPVIRLDAVGTSSAQSLRGMNVLPILQTTASGGDFTIINNTIGMTVWPRWKTIAGSTIDFGDVVGVDFISPSWLGSGDNAGTQNIDDFIGLRVSDIDSDVTMIGDAFAVQSLLTAAADRYMFRNDGGAKSSFGLGSALFGTVGAEEFEVIWDGTKTLEFKGSVDAGGNVALNLNVEEVGFYGVTPVVRAGATAEIKASLVALGLLQGTSATALDLDGGKLTCDEADIDGALNHDGNTAGFYAATPVTQASALTTVLTSITHTGPGTPDYAIATPVDGALGGSPSWGFSTQDEFETVMSVVANLQVRQNELETVLASLGLTA